MKNLLLLILLLAGETALGQELQPCGSHEDMLRQLKDDPQMEVNMRQQEEFTDQFIKDMARQAQKTTAAIYTIPVVFHIVYRDAQSNIPDSLIQLQLTRMNEDFQALNADLSLVPSAFTGLISDAQIQFCLATRDPNGNATTGIVRKATTVQAFSYLTNDIKFDATGGSDAWPRDQYLNIWVSWLSDVGGYAQFPGGNAATDGIAVQPYFVGAPASAIPYYKHVVSHEIGHWLNLRHIWGDDGNSCTGSDLVGDTPNQAGNNGGSCPTFPRLSCNGGGKNGQGPNGDLFVNYMDYAHCICMFTPGQKARMHAVLAPGGLRNTILSSPACIPVPVACSTPYLLNESNITSSAASVSWYAVPQAASYDVSWKPAGAPAWSGTSNTTNTNFTISGLSPATSYEYEVKVNCNDLTTFPAQGSFTTLTNCADNYEPNNTANAATLIQAGTTVSAKITTSLDVDYFKFSNTAGTPNFKVTLSNLPASYNMTVYKQNKNTVVGSVNSSGTQDKSVSYNTNTVATYYIQVFGSGASSSNCYHLDVELSAASFFEQQEFQMADDNQGFDLYPNPATDKLYILYTSPARQDAEISIIDQMGRVCKQLRAPAETGDNKWAIDLDGLAAGVFVVRLKTGVHNGTARILIGRQ